MLLRFLCVFFVRYCGDLKPYWRCAIFVHVLQTFVEKVNTQRRICFSLSELERRPLYKSPLDQFGHVSIQIEFVAFSTTHLFLTKNIAWLKCIQSRYRLACIVNSTISDNTHPLLAIVFWGSLGIVGSSTYSPS